MRKHKFTVEEHILFSWMRLECGATATEGDIYLIMRDIYAKTERPISSGEIREVYDTSRNNIWAHLRRMLSKGMIKKKSRKFYIPNIPRTKGAKK